MSKDHRYGSQPLIPEVAPQPVCALLEKVFVHVGKRPRIILADALDTLFSSRESVHLGTRVTLISADAVADHVRLVAKHLLETLRFFAKAFNLGLHQAGRLAGDLKQVAADRVDQPRRVLSLLVHWRGGSASRRGSRTRRTSAASSCFDRARGASDLLQIAEADLRRIQRDLRDVSFGLLVPKEYGTLRGAAAWDAQPGRTTPFRDARRGRLRTGKGELRLCGV